MIYSWLQNNDTNDLNDIDFSKEHNIIWVLLPSRGNIEILIIFFIFYCIFFNLPNTNLRCKFCLLIVS